MAMSKRRRVVFTSFYVKYLAYLLPVLMRIKMSTDRNDEGNQNLDIKKRVRFEIDMAMVVSGGTHFKWTQNLKQKLELNSMCQWNWKVPIITRVIEMREYQPIYFNVPSSVNYNISSVEMRRREKKRRIEMEAGEREEMRQCIDLLRELVPIGDNEACSMNELMAEVASYVACLQLQVGALRSLSSCLSSETLA
ncbi:hypothetical protein FCM35_KLT16314 [Carex littledalei]|uniref:BHLH domain-containing protein n=1 Tax=Carex littledalei TaxID=544730 RepID=A0A833RPG1_9POAL|nr:hypothetical protein FCM35_KLT16314 [Carex littledalei]